MIPSPISSFPGPELDRHPAGACQEHANLHSRLDLVEKVVSKPGGAVLGCFTFTNSPPQTPLCPFPDKRTIPNQARSPCLPQKVRDAVGALEAELASLQEAVEAPNWRPLPDAPGEKPAGVILGEARPGKEGLLSA